MFRDSRRCGLNCLLFLACALTILPQTVSAQNATTRPQVMAAYSRLDAQYQGNIRPLMKTYCLTCHSTVQQEGELDLERFSSILQMSQRTSAWLKVAEFLDNGEMPPKDAKQPTAEQKKALRKFVQDFLDTVALETAGDPGAVVLRRLSNAEYTYTIRDLTGVPLSPAREFPVDSAAGEGFTNTGAALVMSPALLTKYFDAAKDVASHAVLLPDGFRWSENATRSDWTNETLAKIRSFYAKYSASVGGSKVNLQGIVFNTNDGGRLPIESYLSATLEERTTLEAGTKSIAQVAESRGLNAKYLTTLWNALHEKQPSLLIASIQQRWKIADPEVHKNLLLEISQWQSALVAFRSVGHMKSWMQDVSPLREQQEFREKFGVAPGAEWTSIHLRATPVTGAAGSHVVEWMEPRIVAPGRPDLRLRDVRAFVGDMTARRSQVFEATSRSLAAAASAARKQGAVDRAALAREFKVDVDSLNVWFDYLGIGGSSELKLDLMTQKQSKLAGYDFVNGWATGDLPSLVANSSGNAVRIPGNMKGKGVCVHPTPTLGVAAGWKSPVATSVKVQGVITHAHPECGNGVTWAVELRRGATRQTLASGIAHGAKPVPFGPVERLAVQPGDLVSLIIGPRDGNHSCDLTDIDLSIESMDDPSKKWSLSGDVSPDVHAGNPHADRIGNAAVWHFYSEPIQSGSRGPVIPAGSLLARWQSASDPVEQAKLAGELQELLISQKRPDEKHPDAVLVKQLSSLGGPLLAAGWRSLDKKNPTDGSKPSQPFKPESTRLAGLPIDQFGKLPDGTAGAANSLYVEGARALAIELPADLVEGAEFVTTARIAPRKGGEASAQFSVEAMPGKQAELSAQKPIVFQGEATQKDYVRALNDFRQLFPPALCYTKIVPVDEVVTLTLFHREDDHLVRLMLSDSERNELDRLWNELHFISHDALTLVDAFAQLMEYATQDSDPGLFEPYRKPIHDRASEFRKELVAAEPSHLKSLVAFAEQAYRRPLRTNESAELVGLYRKLREKELPHDEAFRFTLARVLVSPTFLYRLEEAPAGAQSGAVNSDELANRLSYFLWSSMPDAELRRSASSGELTSDTELRRTVQRMLKSRQIKRLATEFACQWLHIYDFDQLDEKSERHFPEFNDLRHDMYAEAIAFFTDLFQRDGSMWEIFESDHTFVNPRLAGFYGLQEDRMKKLFPDSTMSTEFRRLDGIQALGRGGILGMPATLAKQSGASRTSPILRGNWISEVILGERLPRPPKDVPQLPEDETATEGLTVRQLVEKHSSDARCANCHVRIDPLGFALEAFDPIGRKRDKDLAGRAIDSVATTVDGKRFDGLSGLRTHLLTARRAAIQRQFCKKLLGYALGRAVQLSDELLIKEMMQKLDENNGRISVAIEAIVLSPQFRQIRGRDTTIADNTAE